MRQLSSLCAPDILHSSPMEKAGSQTLHFIVRTVNGKKGIEYPINLLKLCHLSKMKEFLSCRVPGH